MMKARSMRAEHPSKRTMSASRRKIPGVPGSTKLWYLHIQLAVGQRESDLGRGLPRTVSRWRLRVGRCGAMTRMRNGRDMRGCSQSMASKSRELVLFPEIDPRADV